jgi:ERCC4-type nuclease
MELVIDARERAVIPYVEALHDDGMISFCVKTITVGDYALTYNGVILAVFERKTWVDLAQSFRDGRKDNVQKLLELRELTNCRVFYIIECPANPRSNQLFSRMPYKNLRSHLDHLIVRDNIHVLHTADAQGTAARLFEFGKNIVSTKPSVLPETTEEKTGGVPAALTAKQRSRVNVQEQLLRCLPSVGSVVSTVLATGGITLDGIFSQTATTDAIAALQYQHGASIGLDRAQRITRWATLLRGKSQDAQKTSVKILAAIPGVSKPTATHLLTVVKFRDLMDGYYRTHDLAGTFRSADTKATLGPALASKILCSLWAVDAKTLAEIEETAGDKEPEL